MIRDGSILNDTYEIITEIGSGGGGVVYRARHLRLQTDVVVKKIRDEIKGKIQSRQEADVLKRLKHPYLPRVYDFIETEDGVYTVMDYIPGEAFDQLLKEKRKFSQKQVVKWAKQLGEALAYLHSQQPVIIHSDIKPANIILTPEGNICLIDFNVSIVIDDSVKSTMGISVGYSAPEQYGDTQLYFPEKNRKAASVQKELDRKHELAKDDEATELLTSDDEATELLPMEDGEDKVEMPTELLGGEKLSEDEETVLLFQEKAKHQVNLPTQTSNVTEKLERSATKRTVDSRSDIYSLGCVLYHLLTGAAPERNFERIVPISQSRAQVSEGLAVIIEKMMQLDPAKRYQNGMHYLEAINNAYKFDRRYQMQRRKERTLLLSAAVLMVMGGLLTGLGVRRLGIEAEQNYQNKLLTAENLAETGAYSEAIVLAKELQLMKADRIEGYEQEIYYLYLSGDYESCIARGEQIVALQLVMDDNPEDAAFWGNFYYVLANCYYELGDLQNAYAYIEKAITYNDSNALYYRDLAIILARGGQLEEAREMTEFAREKGLPEDSMSLVKGEILMADGDMNGAVEAFNAVINTTKEAALNKRAVLLCASALRNDGRIDEEINLLETAMAQLDNQERLSVSEILAAAYMRKAQEDDNKEEWYDKALSLFETLRNSGYVTWQIQENIAILLEQTGNFEEAAQQLLQMAENYPKDYRVYKRLAYLEANRQQYYENDERDYLQMKEYYEQAMLLYKNSNEDDMEMQMLEQMMAELEAGGWFAQ